MQYHSTRDKSISVSSAEAIKTGLSAEGGLFVPESFPSVSLDEIKNLASKSYNERAYFVLSKFLSDFTEEELKKCIDSAYTKEKFETESIAPVYKLNDTTYFLELWHGPTCAFKDMALQILPHLLTTSMKKTNEDKEIVILVATSGDTGKAALEGFKDVAGTRIIVFYPDNGVSEIQKLQMVTQEGNNVSVAAVKGNFDDAQSGVKKIFTDTDYKNLLDRNQFKLSSANSINWGRLVPQIVYYFSSYAELVKNNEIEIGDKINVVVPTGNFGNILAAYYAKKMGLPIAKFICASNENNVLTFDTVNLVFTREDGMYVGTDLTKYPFKIIHEELGIKKCRFYDLRGSYATRILTNGVEIRDVADILGHRNIETTENYYISSTEDSRKRANSVFEEITQSSIINEIIKYKV